MASIRDGNRSIPEVYAQNEFPHGSSYSEWIIRWSEWLLSIPKNRSPLTDVDGSYSTQGQHGPVWFLAGSELSPTTRSCTIPHEKSVMFPVNYSIFALSHNQNYKIADIIVHAREQENAVDRLHCEVDGLDVPKYRFQSRPFDIFIPDDNVLDVSSGMTTAVSDGYWVILKPLSAGKHTIKFGASGFFQERRFHTDVTYQLTVNREG